MQSSMCSLPIFTVRFAKRSMSSTLPSSVATSRPFSALALISLRLAISPDLSEGGLPSKT